MKTSLSHILLLSWLALFSGCSNLNGPVTETDPLEGFNRSIFAFNETLDENIMKPVAEAYHDNIPNPIQTGVSNVFGNLEDVIIFLNDALQFKFLDALGDFFRFVINSTIGIFGIFDVATPLGLEKHNEDFGQTLATWGVGDGPYLVLPFLGPSTMRDTGALAIDWQIDPVFRLQSPAEYWGSIGLRAVDIRVGLLKAGNIVDQASFDKYSFMRDAYLQLRRNRVYDGNPPKDKFVLPPPSQEDLDLEKALEGAL